MLVADIELAPAAGSFGCGSHTATGVPDPANNRLLIYNRSSTSPRATGSTSSRCRWTTRPVQRSCAASRRAPCHDIGVILGDTMKAACSGGTGTPVQPRRPGRRLARRPDAHPARRRPGRDGRPFGSLRWDGKIIIFGHEPGGGVAAACEATDPALDRSFFFYNAESGDLLGTWTLPRTQGPTENCTLHNYNVSR